MMNEFEKKVCEELRLIRKMLKDVAPVIMVMCMVLALLVVILPFFEANREPVCVQNGTEYFYWSETAGKGYIVSDPETDCRVVMTTTDGASKRYWCDGLQEGFDLSPSSDFRLVSIVKDTCIMWEGL